MHCWEGIGGRDKAMSVAEDLECCDECGIELDADQTNSFRVGDLGPFCDSCYCGWPHILDAEQQARQAAEERVAELERDLQTEIAVHEMAGKRIDDMQPKAEAYDLEHERKEYWEDKAKREKERAEQAEAKLREVYAVLDEIAYGAPWGGPAEDHVKFMRKEADKLLTKHNEKDH